MATINEYKYEIDSDDIIVNVSTQWLSFAKYNDAPKLTRTRVEGREIHLFIAGWKLSELYQQLFMSLRRTGSTVTIPFRCDSATVKRFMELELTPRSNGHIEFTGRLLRRVPHANIPLLDNHAQRNGEWQVICSVCRRLKLSNADWREIEEALTNPYSLPAAGVPQLSHDLCPACAAMLQNAAQAG